MRKILKLTEASDSKMGNVHSIAEDGTLVAYSATGSELAPYASTASEVILVGSQKIVSVLETEFRRICEYD